MPFTETQMNEAISKEGIAKDAVDKIIEACKDLKATSGCPDEDIDDLLNFLVGRWSKY
tara:strand:+ start:987 stop:1160 length:174 start_codon:yes stop_codon:yes gene_type:complete